jgi:hypothetical protein
MGSFWFYRCAPPWEVGRKRGKERDGGSAVEEHVGICGPLVSDGCARATRPGRHRRDAPP